MMSLSARIETATWSELDEGLLEEITTVLGAIHRATTRSEDFSRAIPYHVSIKASSSSTITTATHASQPTTSSVTDISPFAASNSITNTQQSIDATSSLSYTRPTKSNVWVSQPAISKLQYPESSTHQDVQSFLRQVQTGKISFWNPHIQQQVTKEEAQLLQVPVNYGVYLCLVLEGTQIHHKILYRFARVALYYLSLQGHTPESLAQALQGITLLKGTDTAMEKIEDYICAGSRYVHIAEQLGGLAALFFLHHDVGNSFWERRLAKSGTNHDNAIQNLRAAGIPEVSEPFRQLAIDLLRLDAVGVVATQVTKGGKRGWTETYRHELSKVPRLSSADRLPRIHYGNFSEHQRGPGEEVVSGFAPSEGEQSLDPRSNSSSAELLTNSTGQDLQLSVQMTSHQRGELGRSGQNTVDVRTHQNPVSESNQDEIVGMVANSRADPSRSIDSHIIQPPMEPVYQGKAEVARMEGLEKIFSNLLLEHMETSQVRQLENARGDTGPVRITAAVSLYLVAQRDKDFKMEISLGSSIGNAISKELAETTSPEYLRTLLGEYLHAGMMSSIQRNEDEKRRMLLPINAVKVFFPTSNDSGDDCKLQVMLGYDAGVSIWYNAF